MHQILNVNCIKVEPCLALQRLAAAWKKTGQLTRGRPEKFSWCGLQSKDAGCNCNPHYNVTSTFRSSEVWPVLRHVAKEKNTLGKSCSASTFFFFYPFSFVHIYCHSLFQWLCPHLLLTFVAKLAKQSTTFDDFVNIFRLPSGERKAYSKTVFFSKLFVVGWSTLYSQYRIH